jgi:dephospho-CoA kinase
VSSDEIVHHLLATDDEVRDALVDRLGEQILGADGRPDRAAIARIVFRDPEALAFLEGLLHPLVSREYLHWRDQLAGLDEPPAVCVTEVPLLYESGAAERFDEREGRLLPDREKVRQADFHYRNVGTEAELDAWVADLMARLARERETG